MIRRILISALAAILVQTSLPVSISAEQPAPAAPTKGEQTKSATSVQPQVYPELPQVKHTLNLQNAMRAFTLAGSTPLQPTLRQTESTGGSGLTSRQKLTVWAIVIASGVGILALENIAPKGNDARCSSTTPQFCN